MTITYEPNGFGAVNSDCEPSAGADDEKAPLTRTNTQTKIRIIPANTTDEISWAWTTEANEPNSVDWPDSDYRGKIKVSQADTGISVKIQLVRINSGCSLQETLGTGGSHAGTGSFNDVFSVNPSAGAAADRYQMRILGTNTNLHMDFTVIIDCDDADTQMIWDEVAAPADPRFLNQDGFFAVFMLVFWSIF